MNEFNVNILDIAVAGVILLFVFIGGYRGLVRSIFGLCQTLASMILTWLLYPTVSKAVREHTGVYEPLKKWIIGAMGVQSATGAETSATQLDIINGLSLPKNFLSTLIANNNPEAYKALGAGDIQSYIGGFIANLVINVLCVLAVFLIVNVALRLLADALDVIAKLPVINAFNRVGGAAIGLVIGGFVVWLGLLVTTLFFTRADNGELYALLERSRLAIFFYDTNLLFNMILQIFV